MENLPDFEPILTYFTEQVTVFAENPLISFFIAGLVGGVLSIMPERIRKMGMLVSVICSILFVDLVARAGAIDNVSIWNVILIGLILGVVTSKGYDFVKSRFEPKNIKESIKNQNQEILNPQD